ncbi:MAG: methylated-DNA--[protein]-cysteine S-methyltransferase [Magnetococcales bacterium]|nr:methylated-DNA--[protein]-cysteine S-methyltransferase [Magnetococcales bacterium]
MGDFVTPIGSYWLQTRGDRITALLAHPPAEAADSGLCQRVGAWLNEYFAGRFPALDSLPLSPEGTDFQRRVWEALRFIAPGRVETYGSLAKRLNSAPRAVGGALAANPIPILLPCHRVVAANGALRGYSAEGGLNSKRLLLALEGIPMIEKKTGIWEILPSGIH